MNGPPPRKEDRPCCTARRDDHGRLPIGYCSPGCLGRPGVWAAVPEPVTVPEGRRLPEPRHDERPAPIHFVGGSW